MGLSKAAAQLGPAAASAKDDCDASNVQALCPRLRAVHERVLARLVGRTVGSGAT